MDRKGHFVIKNKPEDKAFFFSAIVYFKDFTFTSTWNKYFGVN